MYNTDKVIAHNEKQKIFYNSHTPAYLDFTKNKPYADYLVSTLVPFLNPAAKILEVGAGQGRFSFALAEKAASVHATDFSNHEIHLLQKHIQKSRVKNISTGILDLLSETQLNKLTSYDAIVGFFVLHHLPKETLPPLIQTLLKKIKPGGKLIFIEPNNTYPLHAVEMLLMPDMHWEIEKGIYTNYLGIIQKSMQLQSKNPVYIKKFGFCPPFIINAYKSSLYLDKIMESIPILHHVICPFVLISN